MEHQPDSGNGVIRPPEMKWARVQRRLRRYSIVVRNFVSILTFKFAEDGKPESPNDMFNALMFVLCTGPTKIKTLGNNSLL